MYKILDKHTIHYLPRQRDMNQVVLSLFDECSLPVQTQSFSVKYVWEGRETYTLNDHKYSLTPGQYLLANRFCEGKVEIESKKLVKGICIDLLPEILSEVVASFREPGSLEPDKNLDSFFNTPSFPENQYEAHQTHLGKFLLEVQSLLDANPLQGNLFDNEFYYMLAEKIVIDHIPVYKQLQCIPTVKPSTKKDIWRKLLRGKEFMDNSFTQSPDVELVAKQACISSYHFFRLFKAVYKTSPHQYILHKKLEYGYLLLAKDGITVSAAAHQCGFTDIYSFSKAFTKKYGYAPSALIKTTSKAL
jgi:AraC family transcriptional regulator